MIPQQKENAKKAVAEAKTLKGMIEKYEPRQVLQWIPALPEEEIDPEVLRRFLLKNQDMYEGPQQRSQ